MKSRAVLTGLFASLLAGPAAATINQSFGAHTFSYAPGSIRPNHVSQSVQDQAVRDFYDASKGQYRVCRHPVEPADRGAPTL